MAALVYQVFSSSAMVSMGLYHLISTTKNHLKSPRDYFAKPHHPFSSTPSSISFYQRLIGKNLQLYLIILCLLIAFFHQTLISSDFDPLLKGHTPVYRFTTLQSAAVLFLLLILSIVLLLSEITSLLPFPPDLFFGVASGIFFLQYSVSSSSSSLQISKLQVKCDSVSARIFHSLPGPRLPSAALCGGRRPWGLNVTAGIMGIADWTLPVLNVNRFLKKPDGDDENALTLKHTLDA